MLAKVVQLVRRGWSPARVLALPVVLSAQQGSLPVQQEQILAFAGPATVVWRQQAQLLARRECTPEFQAQALAERAVVLPVLVELPVVQPRTEAVPADE